MRLLLTLSIIISSACSGPGGVAPELSFMDKLKLNDCLLTQELLDLIHSAKIVGSQCPTLSLAENLTVRKGQTLRILGPTKVKAGSIRVAGRLALREVRWSNNINHPIGTIRGEQGSSVSIANSTLINTGVTLNGSHLTIQNGTFQGGDQCLDPKVACPSPAIIHVSGGSRVEFAGVTNISQGGTQPVAVHQNESTPAAEQNQVSIVGEVSVAESPNAEDDEIIYSPDPQRRYLNHVRPLGNPETLGKHHATQFDQFLGQWNSPCLKSQGLDMYERQHLSFNATKTPIYVNGVIQQNRWAYSKYLHSHRTQYFTDKKCESLIQELNFSGTFTRYFNVSYFGTLQEETGNWSSFLDQRLVSKVFTFFNKDQIDGLNHGDGYCGYTDWEVGVGKNLHGHQCIGGRTNAAEIVNIVRVENDQMWLGPAPELRAEGTENQRPTSFNKSITYKKSAPNLGE